MIRSSKIAALCAFLAIAGCQGLGPDQEYNYKLGRLGPRYLAEFLKPDPVGALGDLSEFSAADPDVATALRNAAGKAEAIPAISGVDEDIYLVVSDKPGIGFTVGIRTGNVEVREGLRGAVKPTMVLHVARKEALQLPDWLGAKSQDAQGRVGAGLSAESLFKVARLMLIPAMRSLYASDALYQGGKLSGLGFEDFLQIELTPPTGSDLPPARVTVLNVDGQWLFIEGWHGEPDERVSLTVPQALEIYRYAAYDLKKAKSPTDKQLISTKYAELRKRAVVYTRPDHK
ncbi:MAG: hypothetical protein FJZ01_20855 [Candidatus Sericytochromatia bacterium]|nr:hypothetical protein [Candidatus Tanganyikabacteria bacterium]